MCSRAALLAAFFAFINSTTSNHAPVSALPRAGLSLRVALLTTIMSMISPGIWLELKTSVTPGLGLDVRKHRVPGGDGVDLIGVEGGRDVGVGGVDHFQVFLGEVHRIQCPGQQVVGNRQLDQIDVHALEVGDFLAVALEHDAVVAVGEVADDQRGAVDATGRRNGQRVHVGHGAAVELAGGVLVDGFDVVVELHHIDLDAVLLRPFVDDALAAGVFPGHPAGVDGPADAEVVFLGGLGRDAHEGCERSGEQGG